MRAHDTEVSMTDRIKAVANGLVPVFANGPVIGDTSLTNGVKAKAKKRRNPPSTRVGRKGIVIYVDPEVAAAMHRLAAAFENGTVQALGEHAFRLLFAKYREPWPERSVG
jgi:hypothetical protein